LLITLTTAAENAKPDDERSMSLSPSIRFASAKVRSGTRISNSRVLDQNDSFHIDMEENVNGIVKTEKNMLAN